MFNKTIFSIIIPLFILLLSGFIQPLQGQIDSTETTEKIDTITSSKVNFGTVEDTEVIEKSGEEGEDGEDGNDGFSITFNDNKWSFEDGSDLRLGLLDLGFSSYLSGNSFNLPTELDQFELLYAGSINLNFHVIRHRIPIIKSHASIEYGLSFAFMNYKFANDFKIIPNQISFQVEDDGTVYDKNKLKTTFLEVPVLFTLTPGRRKGVYLSGGWYGGILINSKQKLKTESGEKTKTKDDFNLNKFRYGLVGRVGVGPIAFYAQYSLNNLFKDGQGPELRPFNIGVTLLNF